MTTDEIEILISKRDFDCARKEVRKYLTKARYSEESRLLMATLYRRMGDFSSAFKLIYRCIDVRRIEHASEITLLLQMEIARLFTCLGGEGTALTIAERVHTVHQPKKIQKQFAYLCLWFGKFKEALPYFESFSKLKDSELLKKDSYQNRTQMLLSGVCHSYVGHFQLAEKIYAKVLKFSGEPILVADIHTALSEHYILKKNYEKALKESRTSIDILGSLPGSSLQYCEAALAHGACLVFCGRYKEAEVFLTDLPDRIAKPGVTANLWLLSLKWKGLLEFKTKSIRKYDRRNHSAHFSHHSDSSA